MIWNFLTMNQRPFEFFLKFARKSLLLLKFCQIREILKTVLLILLKCIAEGYSNGNESFTGGLFSNYESLNRLFHFFRYLVYSVFHETFVKKFMKKLSFFSSNFKNPFQDVVYYRKFGCLTFVSFEYTAKKVEKCVRFWGAFFRNKKIMTFWIFMNQIFQ